MTQHMTPLSETAAIGFSFIAALASHLLLADAAPAQQYALQWFLLPLVGAMASAVCAMLLNPNPEARKTVLARSIFGVVMGTALPKIVSMMHPALREFALDPAITFLSGFSVCLIAYVIARPFVERLYSRSDVIAEELEHHVESKITKVVVTHSEEKRVADSQETSKF